MSHVLHPPDWRACLSRWGGALNRAGRNGLGYVLGGFLPATRAKAIPEVPSVRRVLLVRVNHRLGNTVLATAMLPVLRARFPGAEVDILAGDTAVRLLDDVGFDQVHLVSRRLLAAPWRAVALLARLRERRYDVAFDGGLRSFSGGLYSWLCGARIRVGGQGRNARFRNVCLDVGVATNVYGITQGIAGALGVAPALARTKLRVAPAEAAAAVGQLKAILGEAKGNYPAFTGLFVGGHHSKRWPRQQWIELCGRLSAAGRPTLVFVGPEETDFLPLLRDRVAPPVHVVPPQSLRSFVGLLARATVLVTPDSGPLHLAAALGVPVVGVFLQAKSFNYLPPGGSNRGLLAPTVDEVLHALVPTGQSATVVLASVA